tara:strand:+ start:49 stop:474 length:426 start_codon:yes stop_codon:yes gene_type:complete
MNDYYINEFIDKFCEIHKVSKIMLFSGSRKRELVDKRGVLAFFLRYKAKLTWQKIGDIMNRKHCAVLYVVNKTEGLISVYPHIKRMIDETNKLYLQYKHLIEESDDKNIYSYLLTDNQRLKERIEKNEKLLKQLINLEQDG